MNKLIIDAYNVIRNISELAHKEKESLEHGRDALITHLADWRRKGSIAAVFLRI